MHCQCIKTTPGTPDAGSGDGGSDLDSVDAESPLYGLKCIAKDCFFLRSCWRVPLCQVKTDYTDMIHRYSTPIYDMI